MTLAERKPMNRSVQEEIVSVLWIIAALIAFGNGHSNWGWIFVTKGAFDTLCAIYFSWKERNEPNRDS
jgi:hypothetical protein